jgi:hypothetical protein
VNWYLCASSGKLVRASENRKPWNSWAKGYSEGSREIMLAGMMRWVPGGWVRPFERVQGLQTIRLNVTEMS